MKIGDKSPDLLGKDENGNEIRRSDYAGKGIILYFYPQDSTPGCTAEACNFRDNLTELRDSGYQVIGVSVDSDKSHLRFKEKNELTFPLISDVDKKLVEEFGVWGEKTLAGRKYMGTFRTTLIIDKDGIITHIFSPKEIKTKEHALQVLSYLEPTKQ